MAEHRNEGRARAALRTVWRTVRRIRFGSLELKLDEVPVRIGSELRGAVGFGPLVTLPDGVVLRLSCIRSRETDTERRRPRVIWSVQTEVAAELLRSGTRGPLAPVVIEIGGGLPTGPVDGSEAEVHWTLDVETPSGETAGSFEIPVLGDEKYGEDEFVYDVPERPTDWPSDD